MNLACNICLAALLCVDGSENCITNNSLVYQFSRQSQKVLVVGRVKGKSGCAVDLSIPSEVSGFSVIGIKEDAFLNDEDLRSVEMEDGIWQIGDRAFKGCSGLTYLNLPNTLLTLGNEAFMDCVKLKEVKLPRLLSDDSGFGAFRGCDDLKRAVLADELSCYVAPFFYGCNGLEEFRIGLNQYYKIIDGCLYDHSASMLVRCPNRSNVTDISVREGTKYIADYAFGGCCNLKHVALPNSVSEIGIAAFFMSGIEELRLPNQVDRLYMETFAGCKNLHTVSLPCNIKYIGVGCFARTKALRQIIFNGDKPEIAEEDCVGAAGCIVIAPKGSHGWDGTSTVWGIPVRIQGSSGESRDCP